MTGALTFAALGEGGVLLEWPASTPVSERAQVIAAAWRALQSRAPKGVVDVVPAPASLLVRFDPLRTSRVEVEEAVREAMSARGDVPRSVVVHDVAVRYGGVDGPDLEAVAARLHLSPDAVIDLHLTGEYTVSSTGFMAGFVYMGPLDERLRLARRGEPRARVPAGSVAIAERQTGIYGVEGPGGWWLIGRTAHPTFDPQAFPPTGFAIGDRVRFGRRR